MAFLLLNIHLLSPKLSFGSLTSKLRNIKDMLVSAKVLQPAILYARNTRVVLWNGVVRLSASCERNKMKQHLYKARVIKFNTQ